MRYIYFSVLFMSAVCFAQPAMPPVIPLPPINPPAPIRPVAPAPPSTPTATAQPPATGEEMKFLRFMLLNIASLDHGADAIASYEKSLVLQFGLSSDESTMIHSAGQTLNTVLAQLRQSTQTLVAGKTTFEPSDIASLASLNLQREQKIEMLANQVLNSVSATTASRLRTPGHILAAKPNALNPSGKASATAQ